jgi:hypothetical protein
MLWVVFENPQGTNSLIPSQCLDNHNKDNILQANFETESTLTSEFTEAVLLIKHKDINKLQNKIHIHLLDFEDKFCK